MLNRAIFEIGVEDLPPSEFDNILAQLEEGLKKSLEKNDLNFLSMNIFISPRRFGAYIVGLPDKQPDKKEKRKGPPKKICFDENNQPTKALEGFAKGQGVQVKDVKFENNDGAEYAYIEFVKAGEPTKIILQNIIPELITNMNFAKSMRWGKGNYTFVRPVHWVLGLYNREILEFEIFDEKSSNKSYGHRFFGEEIIITNPQTFFSELKKNYVIPLYEERIEVIEREIQELEDEHNIKISLEEHEDLIREIAKMTEFPKGVVGSFDEKYLFLPPEIIIVTVRHHQRSFVAMKDGKVINKYVAFQDGFGRKSNVTNGYTRVINARLDDAAFYYEDDLKTDIQKRLEDLKSITYQVELGNYREKCERISTLSSKIAEKLGFENLDVVKRAGLLCKIDIPSKVVYEFPELQGIMARIYLKHKGENEDVFLTAEEHYKPLSENDEISQNLVANIVSIADKIDDIIGYFGIGKIPSGSKDPFALRRKAFGILRILISMEWDLNLKELIDLSEKVFAESGKSNISIKPVEVELKSFLSNRLGTILERENISAEAINSVLINVYKPLRAYLAAKSLDKFIKKEEFQDFITAFQRVNNISKNHYSQEYHGRLFVEEEEKTLFQKYLEVKSQFENCLKKLDYDGAIESLISLKENIDRYFDNIFVMSEDESIRSNRLGFLKSLSALFYEIGDVEKLYKG
ncbi:glycyl-tRNA synthetase subunit beta [Petrotoga sp. 8T1HF07.NaAc.6.1]|uniref:glycine--tRNA ligase subunit beta n=1 Tax=Petrotoga sp. 8T1HF07.NaAc.6.1 TaxID=1351838 RepID=UPI00192B2128|nr:glycine--tRNA ligase subunit beta [Petrotoga sp. 8T1HF07.NaAc.6.1]MBL5980813.1 glycyl-tRNA synthetase subunit beta [Petrotoga sp. 8T1HF07.NaAc.6.1]